jgi:hypothetical protein
MINLPNKQYWLAAERRKETMRYLSMKTGWFACGVLFLHLFVTSAAIRKQFDIGATFAVLFGFTVFMGLWTVLLMRHCRRVPQ